MHHRKLDRWLQFRVTALYPMKNLFQQNPNSCIRSTGSKDPVTGPRTKEFVARLDQLKIPYSFEQYPDQIHSMEVWRPSLNKFITKLFR